MTEEPRPSLRWRNRRVLAERLRWPAGILDDCERIEQEHPSWGINWYADKPRGFTARHRQRRRYYFAAAGETEADLIADMARLDQLAAEQLQEWAEWRPAGTNVVARQ
jgi:hypothetical protein